MSDWPTSAHWVISDFARFVQQELANVVWSSIQRNHKSPNVILVTVSPSELLSSPFRLFHIELWTDHHIVHRRGLSMKMYLRVLQKATTWPLRLCMIILDTFYWLRSHIKHTKRPNRQCWRFFEPKSPISRSLIQSPEIVENLIFRALEKYFVVEEFFLNSFTQ